MTVGRQAGPVSPLSPTYSARRLPCRFFAQSAIKIAIVCIILPTRAAGETSRLATTAPAHDSLARFVPADTRLFVEIRGLRGLEQEWSQSDWGSALSSLLIGRADDPASGDAALRPLAELLGIADPAAMRRGVFGTQVAVALPSWSNLAQGLIVAIPDDVKPIEEALVRRGLKATAHGGVREYPLDDHGHRRATNGHLLVLGQQTASVGGYDQAVRLLAGEPLPSLAGDALFRREIAALGPGPHRATVYFAGFDAPAAQPESQPASSPATRSSTSAPATTQAATPTATTRATTAPATQPARRGLPRWWPATWPMLMRGAVGLAVEGQTISLGIRGELDQPSPPHRRDADFAVLNALPATTLAAWAQTVDYAGQHRLLTREGPTLLSLYLAFIDMRMKAAGSSLVDGLLARLGYETIVLLGVIPPSDQTERVDFDVVALGLIVSADRPAEAAQAMDLVGESFASILNLPAVRARMKESVHVAKVPFEGHTLSELRLGEFFRTQTGCPFTYTIALSWVATERDIILSTHSDHIRQILRARAGRIPTLGPKIAAAGPLNGMPRGADVVLLAQPAEAAAVLEGWLAWLERNRPEVLKPEWWRERQERQAGRASLGISMPATRPTEAVVHNTLPGWPAYGRLQAGDRIVAVDGIPLTPTNPRASLKELITRRKGNAVVLTVERNGQRADVTIPLPEEPISFDPIGAIRQITTLLRPFAAASYTVWAGQPDRFDARVMLRAAPHRPRTTTSAPAPQPASRPASPPAWAPVSTRATSTASAPMQ